MEFLLRAATQKIRFAGGLAPRPQENEVLESVNKAIPIGDGKGFSALAQVGDALAQFQPLRMASFQTPATPSSMAIANRRGRGCISKGKRQNGRGPP